MTMEWLAIALFAAYGLVGFGLRAAVLIRRTGDSGFRGVSGSPGTAEWWAGVLFGVAVLAALLGPFAGLLGLAELAWLSHAWIQAVGVAVTVVGVVATFVTQLAMGDSWRVGVDVSERTQLVTAGPFGLVRNPIFTAMLVTGVGLVLMVPNVVAVLGWLLLLTAIQLQVRVVEEPHLHRHHGESYRRYTVSVGRFIPGVGRG